MTDKKQPDSNLEFLLSLLGAIAIGFTIGYTRRWLGNHGYNLSHVNEDLVCMVAALPVILIWMAALTLVRSAGYKVRDPVAEIHGTGQETPIKQYSPRGLLLLWAIFALPFALLSIVEFITGRSIAGIWSLSPFAFWIFFAIAARLWQRKNKMQSMRKRFFYLDGKEILSGDRVRVEGKMAYIEKVLQPRTSEARNWALFDTGGLLIHFDDDDLWVQEEPSKDIDLYARAEELLVNGAKIMRK